MATRTAIYQVEYRESIQFPFQELVGASSEDFELIVEVAQAYAMDHPGYNVRILDGDEFIRGYKFNPKVGLYQSIGNGWFLHEGS